MLSDSLNTRRLVLPRPVLPAGWLPSAAMGLLLAFAIARSTVAAGWVPGSQVIVPLAVGSAGLMGVLAMARRVPWPAALGLGALGAPVLAYVASAPILAAAHPGDPHSAMALARVWAGRLADGEAASDGAFFLYLLCLLFWMVGGWLAWCLLRWRQPLLGLVPGAAAFATTILNYPDGQNGYLLAFLVLTLGLLLWNQYQRSLADVRRRNVRVSGDAGWDFWETGAVVTAAVVAFGIFAPPLTTVDHSVDIENGVFRGWAELNQRLNHPVAFGHGEASGTSIGFNGDVKLAGPVHKTGGIVLTYTLDGAFNAPRYFRGINDVRTAGGEWRFGPAPSDEGSGQRVGLVKDQAAAYAEVYGAVETGAIKVAMLKPPKDYEDVIFYPGQLASLDRQAFARQVGGSGGGVNGNALYTVDRLSGPGRSGGAGRYRVTVRYSVATEQQLREAPAAYPAWLDPYRNFAGAVRLPGAAAPPAPLTYRGAGYRPPATLQRIHDLALQITAGRSSEYDQLQAIESYLRANYTYTLTPTPPPAGVDPLEYFLFASKAGYCEYFATAMGDLARSLGIPVRLVDGYGPGSYDDHLKTYVVRESDAHTWVEAYVPAYGWIQFEPTPDGTYFPILRGAAAGTCIPDAEFCDAGGGADAGGGTGAKPDKVGPELDPGSQGGGGAVHITLPHLALALLPGAAVLLVVLAGLWVLASRWLRPAAAGPAWRRARVLARLGGVAADAGETPQEYGRRLGEEAPGLRAQAARLAAAYTVAAYGTPEAAAEARGPVLEAFSELRPLLLRRIRDRVRHGARAVG